MSELLVALVLAGVLLRSAVILLAVVAAIYSHDTKRRRAGLEVLRILRARDERTSTRLRRQVSTEPGEIDNQRDPSPG